jgi:hypothetical protein
MKAPRRRLVLPLLLGAAFVVLFDSPFVYPFRLFVVFLHEVSHGVAAILTGGRIVSIGLGTLVATALYVRTPFGLVYAALAGLVLVVVAAKLPVAASEALLAAIGAMSALYAVADVASDVLRRHSSQSDAAALARLTGVPAVVWGVLWIGVSIAVLVALVRRLA